MISRRRWAWGSGYRSKLPPQVAWQDVEFLAVFGDGAAGEFGALEGKLFDEFLVTPRMGGVFAFNDFGEGGFDAGVGDLDTAVGIDAAGEEITQLIHAVRGGDVFARNGAANSGFMDPHGIGDL